MFRCNTVVLDWWWRERRLGSRVLEQRDRNRVCLSSSSHWENIPSHRYFHSSLSSSHHRIVETQQQLLRVKQRLRLCSHRWICNHLDCSACIRRGATNSTCRARNNRNRPFLIFRDASEWDERTLSVSCWIMVGARKGGFGAPVLVK